MAPNRRNKRNRRCTLKRGTMKFNGHAGVNTVRFKGWLTKRRKLTPGRYTLVIEAITPGLGSTKQKLKFKVVR